MRLLTDDEVLELLRSRPRIAMIGASANPVRPANGVLRNLRRVGYDVVAVNPSIDEIEGLPCYPTLADAIAATGRIVDVFRRPDQCALHAREAVEAGAGCLWLQLGIANLDAARIAHEARLAVVMDRCTSIEVGRLATWRPPAAP